MKITVAESAGFCFGVNRAVKMVYEALDSGKQVATLGPIIHNQDVVDDMVRRGARIIQNVSELTPGEYVVIRSHGVGKRVYDAIAELGNPMIDATCPFVQRIHKIVAEKTKEGYFILIAGDENHPEVQGIIGHCNENYFVFKDQFVLNDIFSKIPKNFQKKLAIVSQTTYNSIVWRRCLEILSDSEYDVHVFDTICSATGTRQSDAAELAQKSDCMIVIGGKHSSNTVKLADVSSAYCRTYHIENADEISALELADAENIGITAGASTPAHIIKEVVSTMEEMTKNLQEEEIDFAQYIDENFTKLHNGKRVKGIVTEIGSTEITVDLGAKQTGYVALSEMTNDPSKKPADMVSVGDEIDLIVIKVNDQEGTAQLSKKRVDEAMGVEKIKEAKDNAAILTGVVSAVVKGGVNVFYEGIRVFIPASQTGKSHNADLESMKGEEVRFMIIEVPERRKSAVGSIKRVMMQEKDAAKAKFWETAEVGKEYQGEVKSLTNYGAFVDLGGIDGMVHISELSWKKLKHPSQVVKVGDVLDVFIKDLDQENDRISLGYKKTEDNPWEKFTAEYQEGDIVTVKVVSTTTFGAFAQIIDGVDGLIHISQLANRRVENVKDVVAVGDEVDVKITKIDADNKRISLSIRALENEGAEAED